MLIEYSNLKFKPMRTLFTSLLLMIMSISFAQTSPMTYVDAKGNSFEFKNRTLIYTPSGTTGIYSGTSAKTVGLTSMQVERLELLFNSAIAATSDHIKINAPFAGTIKYKLNNQNKTVLLKAGSDSKNNLEETILVIMNG